MSLVAWIKYLGLTAAIVVVHIAGVLTLPDVWNRVRYWQSGGYAAAAGALFSLPLLAAWAAWQEWRYRRASTLHQTSVRSRAQLSFRWHGLPALSVLVLSVSTAFVVAARSTGPIGASTVAVLTVLVPLMGCGAIAWGAAIGRALPLALSLPVSALGMYLFLALPMTLMPFNIRHVVGVHLSCCFIDREPSGIAVGMAVVFWLVVVAASTLTSVYLPSMRWAPALALMLAGSLALVLLVRNMPPLDADGSQPRRVSLLRCEGHGPVVCLWPEHEEYRPDTQAAAATVASRLAAAGVSVPQEATEAFPAPWSITPQPDPDTALYNAALGLVTVDPPACAMNQDWPMGLYQHVLGVWVAQRVGIPEDVIQGSFDAGAVAEANRKNAEGHEVQAEWFENNLAQIRECGVDPLK